MWGEINLCAITGIIRESSSRKFDAQAEELEGERRERVSGPRRGGVAAGALGLPDSAFSSYRWDFPNTTSQKQLGRVN